MLIDVRPGDRIWCGDGIVLTVLDIDGPQVRFALDGMAPASATDDAPGWDAWARAADPPLTCR